VENPWLVVINREHAKIFAVHGEKIEFLRKFENPEGGFRKREFANDRPGMNRSKFMGSQGLHAMTGGKDPTIHLEEVFAAHVADIISAQIPNEKVDHLTLAAEPKMCGFLRSAMGHHHVTIPIVWWQRDCGKLSNQKIEKMMKRSFDELHPLSELPI
jgi:protein required for attachment to host cells